MQQVNKSQPLTLTHHLDENWSIALPGGCQDAANLSAPQRGRVASSSSQTRPPGVRPAHVPRRPVLPISARREALAQETCH